MFLEMKTKNNSKIITRRDLQQTQQATNSDQSSQLDGFLKMTPNTVYYY
jgi:hypothetical protein